MLAKIGRRWSAYRLAREEGRVRASSIPAPFREDAERVRDKCLGRFRRVLIWGLRSDLHTHRYIHKAFFETFIKLGIPAQWLDDRAASAAALREGDLVFAVNVAARHLPAHPDAHYCLHNFAGERDAFIAALPAGHWLNLQVYTRAADEAGARSLRAEVRHDPVSRTLYQAWGTDLLPWEFLPPVCAHDSRRVYWVGSVWDNDLGQGNVRAVQTLKRVLQQHGLEFVHRERITQAANIGLMRRSRIAPAIAGEWQVDNDYLPCRLFKNISYGCAGLSNVGYFDRLLGDARVHAGDFEQAIEVLLSLAPSRYLELVERQQHAIRHHTYLDRIENILDAL